MNIEKKELWERLENEPERAYRAFETFLLLPSGERTLLAAYRSYVGNPEAAKPSDTWSGWSSEYAWRERALAFDDHMTSKRHAAYARGMQEEAEEQGAAVERTRHRLNEMLAHGYTKTVDYFENINWNDLRFQDAVSIIKLHLETAKEFSGAQGEGLRPEDDWNEVDDLAVERVLRDLQEDQEGKGSEDAESG